VQKGGGEGLSSGPSFVFGGQHCEGILITQGGIDWEEIVESVGVAAAWILGTN